MAAVRLIVLLTNLYLFSLLADYGLGTEEQSFRPMCSRMCNSSADFRENDLFSYKCSCSKSCVVYNDCCYDSPYKDRGTSARLAFACMSVEGLGNFRAVVSCPQSWRANSCTELLGYMPPVTSKVTNITYGNVFCAACNEDGDNLIRWNVHLRCPMRNDYRDIDLDFSQLKYRWGTFWGRNAPRGTWRPCKFHAHYNDFRILRDLELRPCVRPTKVDKCPDNWRGIFEEQKCRSYEDPVYVGNMPFRNSHCAECHRMNSSETQCIPAYVRELLDLGMVDKGYVQSCMAVSPQRCVTDLGKGVHYSLSFLFADHTDASSLLVDGEDSKCVPPPERLCCRGERYDDNTARCRPVRRG